MTAVRTVDQATNAGLAIVRANREDWPGRCRALVRTIYGAPGQGGTAAGAWREIPASLRHPWSDHPPEGACSYWSGGSSEAGHVVYNLGGGTIISNDRKRNGYADVVSLASIDRWGLRRLGYAFSINGYGLIPVAPPVHHVSTAGMPHGGSGLALHEVYGRDDYHSHKSFRERGAGVRALRVFFGLPAGDVFDVALQTRVADFFRRTNAQGSPPQPTTGICTAEGWQIIARIVRRMEAAA